MSMNDLNFVCVTCLSNVETGSASISDPMCVFLREVLHFKCIIGQNSSKLICRNCYRTLIELRRFYAQLRDVELYFESKSKDIQRRPDNAFSVETLETSCTIGTDSKADVAERMRLDPVLIEPETVLVVKDKIIENRKNKLSRIKFTLNGKPTSKAASKRIVCLVCSMLFSTVQDLRSHETIHISTSNDTITPVYYQTSQKRYACPVCGLRFNMERALVTHQKVHENEKQKPYRCRKCKRRFPTENAHRDHELMHTEVEMCQCEICSKKYYNEASLEAHMRVAHNCSTASAEMTDPEFHAL